MAYLNPSKINYVPLELTRPSVNSYDISVAPIFKDESLQMNDLNKLFRSTGTTDILILLPILDEEPILLQRTLESIQKNIYEGRMHKLNIGVVIIYEGWKNFYSRYSQSTYSQFFDQFIDIYKLKACMKRSQITGFDPARDIMHCFFSKASLQNPSKPKLKVMFCIKQLRRTRLHTHLWFMHGFCLYISPQYILQLLPGVNPRKTAIRCLWNHLSQNSFCGAVTGDIRPSSISFFNFIVAAQTIEYKFVNTFENTMETLIGSLSVLPEHFSMIRWSVLENKKVREFYFQELLDTDQSMIKANFFNSYERVLPYIISISYRLESKNKTKTQTENHPYSIEYVHSAQCDILIPNNMLDFIKLKHNLINGAFCALIRYSSSFGLSLAEIPLSARFLIFLRAFWSFFNFLFVWLIVGIGGVSFMVTLRETYPNYADVRAFNVLDYIILFYFMLVLIVLIMSIGSSSGSIKTYYTVSIIWRAYMFSLIAMFIYTHHTLEFRHDWMIWLLAVLLGLLVLIIIIYSAWKPVIFCLIPFILMVPSYVNILSIYAMCNVHDCTYSKDPADVTKEERDQMAKRSKDRAYIVCCWCISNYLFIYATYKGIEKNDNGYVYSYAIGTTVILLISVRCIFAIFYGFRNCIWNNTEISTNKLADAIPRSDKRTKQQLPNISVQLNQTLDRSHYLNSPEHVVESAPLTERKPSSDRPYNDQDYS